MPTTCSFKINNGVCLLGSDSTIVKNVCSSPCILCIKDNAEFTQDFCV